MIESSRIRTKTRHGVALAAAVLGLLAVLYTGHAANAAVGFTVSGKNLKDANGSNFLIRGVSNPHIWFDTDAFNALTNLAAKKCNTIRIVWTTSGTASRLDQIMTRCEALKMVPMVELHDATGGTTASSLNNCANYWARSDVAAVLKNHARDVLINIANEWGNGSTSDTTWRDDYEGAITIIRNAGIVTTLVIDGPNWGQSASAAQTYGQTLLNFDPQHNLLFSVHMYGSWNSTTNISNAISSFSSKNLPFIVGEFGWNFNNGNNNLGCQVNDIFLMQTVQQFGYGYLAWSMKGNDSANAWLDLTTDWNTPTSTWGNDVFNSSVGIGATGHVASIFGGGGGGGGAPVNNGTYKIISFNSGKALDVTANGTADGTFVEQWTYGGGNNQRFTMHDLGGGQWSIIGVGSGKAVEMASTSTTNGTRVDIRTYTGASNQKWTLTATSGGNYRITPVSSSGSALDVAGASMADGAVVEEWTSNGGTNQQWSFQAP